MSGNVFMLIFPSLLIVLSLRDFCSLFFSRLPERMKLKSGNSSWNFLMAIFFTSWEIVLIKTIPWAFRREFLLSNRCMDHVIPNSLRAIYFVMTAFYANELFELLRSNHPMYKDYRVMLTHHITALALLVVSYAWNFHRYALIIFLEGSKLIRYRTFPKAHRASDITFCLFACVFVTLRLVVYPFFVCPAFVAECKPFQGWLILFLLVALFLMNSAWACLIGKTVGQLIRHHTVPKDVRDEDEVPLTGRPAN